MSKKLKMRCELCGNTNKFKAPKGYYLKPHYDSEDGTTYVYMYSENNEWNLTFEIHCMYCGNTSFTDHFDSRYTLPGHKMVCLKCGRSTFIEYPKELKRTFWEYFEDVKAYCTTELEYDTGLKKKLYCICNRPRYVDATDVEYFTSKRFRIMRDQAVAKMIRDYNDGKYPTSDEFMDDYDGIRYYQGD